MIKIKRLDDILSTLDHLPDIDILSVDVEGLDLQVLRSNDWNRFRPNIIIAECLSMDTLEVKLDSVNQYLSELGYLAFAKTGHSVIFRQGIKC
jgi:hypothetical protein